MKGDRSPRSVSDDEAVYGFETWNSRPVLQCNHCFARELDPEAVHCGECGKPFFTVSKSGVEQEGYTPPAHLWEELDKGLIRLLEASKAKVGEDGWKHVANKRGVSISRRASTDAETKLDCCRGGGLVEATPEVIANTIGQFNDVRAWDPQLMTSKMVQQIDEQTHVIHHEYMAKKCIVKVHRDFLFVNHKRVLKDGTICIVTLSRLADQDMVPVPQNCKRAFCFLGGWVIRDLQDVGRSSTVTLVVQVDFKGLPDKIIDIAMTEQPLIIARLNAHLKGLPKSPDPSPQPSPRDGPSVATAKYF